MPQVPQQSPRHYPDGWHLGLLPETDKSGTPFVAFVRKDTAEAASLEAWFRTGVPMEVITRSPRGYGYRPARIEAAA